MTTGESYFFKIYFKLETFCRLFIKFISTSMFLFKIYHFNQCLWVIFIIRIYSFSFIIRPFRTYLTVSKCPRHLITFCIPIQGNSNDIATVETCLHETKTVIIETNCQREAVVVIDENYFDV